MNRALPLFGLAVVSMVGCFDIDRVPSGPPTGYETDVRSCNDGRDNDNDGLVDCQDPDCIARNHCGEIIPLVPPGGFEGSVATCTDAIDNDIDGQFDCGDRGCQAIRELCCVTEFSDATCSNGIDDDGNGFFDCQDFSCRNNPFVTVCQRETICDDGVDNDGDRFEDCDDTDCITSPACDAPALGPEDTLEKCMDGFDNNANGFTDCGDFDCCGNSECSMPVHADLTAYCAEIQENSAVKCTDGEDNDGNGFADCREFSCCDRDEFADECEASYDSCVNGLDDEGDGFPDCNDFSCRDVVQPHEFESPDGTMVTFDASPCNEAVALPDDFMTNSDRLRAIQQGIVRCTDGIDGDSDGFLDCDDWDCQWNPLLSPRATGVDAPGLCQGGVFDPTIEGGRGGWRIPTADETPLQTNRRLLCR